MADKRLLYFITSLVHPVFFFLNIFADSSVRTVWSCLILELKRRVKVRNMTFIWKTVQTRTSSILQIFSEIFYRTLTFSCIHEHAPHCSCLQWQYCTQISPDDTQTRHVTGLSQERCSTVRKDKNWRSGLSLKVKMKVSWYPTSASTSKQPPRTATKKRTTKNTK